MVSTNDDGNVRPVWFVGAAFGGYDDQTERFLKEGIWETHHDARFVDQVKSILAGDRIAIKAWYTRKNGLPFDNRGYFVSVMDIRAIGTVTENVGDGNLLRVKWTRVDPLRKWYFYTYRRTIWEVQPDHWMRNALIRFAFEGEDQDIDRFRNAPYWRDRFGDPGYIEPSSQNPSENGDKDGSYTVDDILEDGCFLTRDRLSETLIRFEEKRNLILQGPPGTGKTWLGKRLAYALIGERDDDRVRSFQFHPNMSYEDFVRGYRPNAEGRLDLVEGPFMDMVNEAKEDPDSKYVIVIEEINRGNPAQILGEMLTLLEADKRKPEEALRLVYAKEREGRVYIPENLYVIGTMNVADRSLALVDFALRRRFAFVNLEPALNERWLGWVSEHCGIDTEFLSQIKGKLDSLNETIARDRDLGPQFKIGHSFVTPTYHLGDAAREWYRDVVNTEIGPLLDEYWFDAPERARQAKDDLLSGI